MNKSFKKIQNIALVVSKKINHPQWVLFAELIANQQISERPFLMAIDSLLENGQDNKACELLVLGCDVLKSSVNVLEKTVFTLRHFKKEGQAIKLLKERIKTDPHDWHATRFLARIMFHRADKETYVALIDDFYKRHPHHVGVLIEQVKNNLLGDGFEIEVLLQQILEVEPNNFYALTQMHQHYCHCAEFDKASVLLAKIKQSYPEEALSAFCEALQFEFQQDFETALRFYQLALERNPQFIEAYGKSGNLLIKLGQDLDEAWYRLESRFPQLLGRPEGEFWRGQDLSGKTLFIWAEQGIGDQLLYTTMLDDLLLEGKIKEIILECDDKLVPILKRSFPHLKIYTRLKGRHHSFDYHIPIYGLARYLRKELSDFEKVDHPFLVTDDMMVQKWKVWLDDLDSHRKIGLCWRSGAQSRSRRYYQFDLLSGFKDVLSLKGITFINLVHNASDQELLSVKEQLGVEIHRPVDLDLFNDIDGTAALIKNLESVISIASAPARISQSIGGKTYMINRGQAGVVEGLWRPYTTESLTFDYQHPWDDFTPLIQTLNK